MIEGFVCDQCGNSDPRKIGIRNGKPYCRACVKFIGNKAELSTRKCEIVKPKLDYELSYEQKELSRNLIKNTNNGILTLIYAVCGAGKTEITYGLIAETLSKGKRVGFALPRKDVVRELAIRLRETFPTISVAEVYGGNTSQLVGDVVVCTTHQLYRYANFFDLLIIDEVDAFPFKGDKELSSFAIKSYKETLVLMSATPSEKLLKKYSNPGYSVLTLKTRFHKFPIPVPEIVHCPNTFKFFVLLSRLEEFINEGKPVLIFVPTIEQSISYNRLLKIFFKKGSCVNSLSKNRNVVIEQFKQGKLDYLVTTSVLERGITIKNLQVIVINADSEFIFDKATLVQIVGRAGRKIDCPTGEVIFIASNITSSIKECIEEVKKCNEFL